MATTYVSKLGNDGTGVRGDPLLPFLTVTAAEAVNVNGDTVIISDGVYKEATYINNNIPNITYDAENDYGVTIQQGGGQSRVFNIPSITGDNMTLGKIIIDTEGLTGVSVSVGGNQPDIHFAGTKFINLSTSGVINTTLIGGVSFTDGWGIDDTAAGSRVVTWKPSTAQSFTMTDGSIALTGASTTGSTGIVELLPTLAGCTASISGNAFT